MQNLSLQIRQNQRIKKSQEENQIAEDEEYFAQLSHKSIVNIENDHIIFDSINELLSEDNDTRYQSLLSLMELSNHFSNMILRSFTRDHFSILYQYLQFDETRSFVLTILVNFSKKSLYTPPDNIFQILTSILQNFCDDDSDVDFSLVIIGNLINRGKDYALKAIQFHLIEILSKIPNLSHRILKLKIWIFSLIFLYENFEIEDQILSFLMTDEILNSNKISIYRELINCFNNSIKWSQKSINIVKSSNIFELSIQILLSCKEKAISSSLSFYSTCVRIPLIENICFIPSLFILLSKNEEEDFIYEDCIDVLIDVIEYKQSFSHILLISLNEVGLNSLLSMKSFSVKTKFLSLIEKIMQNCPTKIYLVNPNELFCFLFEMIESSQEKTLLLAAQIICLIVGLNSDCEWSRSFLMNLSSHDVFSILDQSSLIETHQGFSEMIEMLASCVQNTETS
ncbi:hypothetical protein TRFO_07352 [Tritrichomonas foetus]|uniref:Uncharacterized protein n=1 Tax=Tritrichomonas foetus TaxID=1144522 RepID=A0A1J4JRQ1_9EUKA|nr:hypothetical protein TRFO_07352 [Tritrichomonas foetus]|eukprot:OHT01801.1 hypothetical protein TRFO_07352 [Tritrichomonas foetus]